MAVKRTRTALAVCAFIVVAVTLAAEAQRPNQEISRRSQATATATIPGPLVGFLRLAAISTKVNPDEVLPLVARNVIVLGYEGRDGNRQATEYLILLKRYVQQARELRALADNHGVIRVPSCEQSGKVLAVLGYRLRQGCGKQASVETAEPSRAFVTLYSAFPLTDLEESLRAGTAFEYAYPSAEVPMLFSRDDWLGKQTGSDLVDALLNDSALARLYWAVSRMDSETRDRLRASFSIRRLLPYGAVLDFYGGELSMRSGHALVPGGPSAEGAWEALIGTSPRDGENFVMRLIAKDSGWAAALFDVLSRTDAAHRRYFTEPARLEQFYNAVRGRDPSPGPARAVFRSDTAMFLLASRLPLEQGRPSIPANVEVWNRILRHELGGSTLKTADELVSALFRLARHNATHRAVEMYLSVSEIDHAGRSERL